MHGMILHEPSAVAMVLKLLKQENPQSIPAHIYLIPRPAA